MQMFYEPTKEHLKRLNAAWSAAYSGGKDSTALVTWLEWLRRAGFLNVCPHLVQSNTTVEERCLQAISDRLMNLLTKNGWQCDVVIPEVQERLYCQILGRGLPPVHPGVRNLRWCTRSTKIDPMDRCREQRSIGMTLTGLRLGESAIRDEKLKKSYCAAGGECGIPEPGENRYSPIIEWKTCQVVDWLSGQVGKDVFPLMGDMFEITADLVDVYGIKTARTMFDELEVISNARFGCIGCPAISAERYPTLNTFRRNGKNSPLNELYDVWYEARLRQNRLARREEDGTYTRGPLKMETRRRLFARVMDIQQRAGVVLISDEDGAFIRDCWERKVYPNRWSEADEHAKVNDAGPLFSGANERDEYEDAV